MDFRGKSAVERQVVIFSFYRDAELRGANLLFKLLNHLKDADAQVKMAKHLSDETRHAWLWTKRIADLGGTPILIEDGYQRRLGLRVEEVQAFRVQCQSQAVVNIRADAGLHRSHHCMGTDGDIEKNL